MADERTLIVKLPLGKVSTTPLSRDALNGKEKPQFASWSKATSGKITSHFTQSQLALALSIQKSKPEGACMKEHCRQLSKYISKGQSPSREQARYIDTAEFWRDQYTKMHLEKKKLEGRVHFLEHGEEVQDSLQANSRPAEDDVHLQQLAVEVLNHQHGGLNPANKRLASSFACGDEPRNNEHNGDPLGANDVVLELSSYVIRIAKQRKLLDDAIKVARDNSSLNQVNYLAQQVLQTLGNMDSVLIVCCLSIRLLRSDSDDSKRLMLAQRFMNQVTYAFLSCFSALNELCSSIPGRSRKSEVVHRMVMFFRNSLDLLHTVSMFQAEHERGSRRSSRYKRTRREEGEYASSKYMTAMMVSICQGLEWKAGQPGHADLLEGCLFSLMEHIGRMLSEAVFAEHVAASTNAGNITTNQPASNIEMSNCQSRYMVQILYAALGGISRKDLISQVLVGEKSTLRDREPASRISGNLVAKARNLLQSTLVKSALGGTILHTLRLPTPPVEASDLLVDESSKTESYGPEWLIETVWALVGWDSIA